MDNSLTIKDSIKGILLNRLQVQVPAHDTELMETGLLDSMSLIELITALEETFNITIPFEDLELDNFRSINTIENFVLSITSVAEVTH